MREEVRDPLRLVHIRDACERTYNKSDEFAYEMRRVLVKYFQKRIDEETERLWNEGILDQNALDRINEEDLHARPKLL